MSIVLLIPIYNLLIRILIPLLIISLINELKYGAFIGVAEGA